MFSLSNDMNKNSKWYNRGDWSKIANFILPTCICCFT